MKYFFIFLFLIESSFLTAQQNPPVMFQIKTEMEIPEDFKDGAFESLTLLKYSLIDESAQKEAIKEQSEQRKKECYEESCLVDTGKMLAAKGLIIVEITKKEENNYRFKAVYIDIETAVTTKITSKYFKNSLNNFEELKNFGKILIEDLFKATNKENLSEKEEKIDEEKLEKMVEEKLKKKEEETIQEEVKRASAFNNKDSFSVLIMGEGIGLSGMYSRRFSKSFAINFGGGFPTLPFISLSYLSGKTQFRHSFETTIGMNYIYIADENTNENFSLFAGIGYRYSSQDKDGGFFFRTMLYVIKIELISDTPVPYWGMNLGYSY